MKTNTERWLEKTPEPNKTYLKNLVRSKHLRDVKEKTIEAHISKIYVFLRDLEQQDAKTITKEQVEDWYLSIRNKYTKATLYGYIITIKMFFKFLYGNDKGGEIMANIRTKRPRTCVKEEELLDDAELKQLMHAATNERDRALIAVLYSSGARIGEILGANIGDITFNDKYASLHVDGKTGERNIDMFIGVPELCAWLNVHPLKENINAPLFVSHYKHEGKYTRTSSRNAEYILKRIAKEAGISSEKRINPHAFRHKRATDVAEILTTNDMRGMFGWSPGSSMPDVYIHSSRKNVLTKLAAQVGISLPDQKPKVELLKTCPNCGCINGANNMFCSNCHTSLNTEQN